MNTRLRTTSLLAAALGALALTSTVSAGLPGPAQEKLRQQGEARSEAHQPRQQQEARHEAAPRGNLAAHNGNGNGNRSGAGGPGRGNGYSRSTAAGGAAVNVPHVTAPVATQGSAPAHSGAPNVGGNGRNVWNNRGNVGSPANGGNASNGGKSWNGGAWNAGNNYGGNYANHSYRPPRVVTTLPPGYRHYNWHGSPYYQHAGLWYRPYGTRYVVTGAPYGLFVSYLPGYYSSFWFGSTRYYYADSTYYLYEPAQHGYIVTHSPYTSEENSGERQQGEAQDEDLYIYPAQGQSEQQQADDRYECHRWGTEQSGYDPIDSDYDAARRADYLRAMTACLTGRGYSVR